MIRRQAKNFLSKANAPSAQKKNAKFFQPLEEKSAGGIVYKRTPRGIKIGLILDPFRRWAFAKGHIETGETGKEAALREVREEMGLKDLEIVSFLGQIDYCFREKRKGAKHNRSVHKTVDYFLMKTPRNAQARPQYSEKIHRIIWVSPERAVKLSDYKDVAPVLRKALEILDVSSGVLR